MWTYADTHICTDMYMHGGMSIGAWPYMIHVDILAATSIETDSWIYIDTCRGKHVDTSIKAHTCDHDMCVHIQALMNMFI